jgi:hypothetical protein
MAVVFIRAEDAGNEKKWNAFDVLYINTAPCCNPIDGIAYAHPGRQCSPLKIALLPFLETTCAGHGDWFQWQRQTGAGTPIWVMKWCPSENAKQELMLAIEHPKFAQV